jgi:hypothetical protein
VCDISIKEAAVTLESEQPRVLIPLTFLNLIFPIVKEVIIISVLRGCWEIKNEHKMVITEAGT